MATGWAFGARPAGFDSLFGGNLAVTGGTGAFLGVRGEGGEAGRTQDIRIASVIESPAVRRTLGGGARQFAFRLIPAGRLNLD